MQTPHAEGYLLAVALILVDHWIGNRAETRAVNTAHSSIGQPEVGADEISALSGGGKKWRTLQRPRSHRSRMKNLDMHGNRNIIGRADQSTGQLSRTNQPINPSLESNERTGQFSGILDMATDDGSETSMEPGLITEETNCSETHNANDRYSSSFNSNSTTEALNVDDDFKVAGEAGTRRTTSVHVGEDITLCWIETTTIKEDRSFHPVQRFVIREYTISFENSATIPERYLECVKVEGEIDRNNNSIPRSTLFEIMDENTRHSRVINFTTVSHSGDLTVWQHRRVRCGVGPVMTKNIVEWDGERSENTRRMVEIKVGPKTHRLTAQPTDIEPCTTDLIDPQLPFSPPTNLSSSVDCVGENCGDSTTPSERLTSLDLQEVTTQSYLTPPTADGERDELTDAPNDHESNELLSTSRMMEPRLVTDVTIDSSKEMTTPILVTTETTQEDDGLSTVASMEVTTIIDDGSWTTTSGLETSSSTELGSASGIDIIPETNNSIKIDNQEVEVSATSEEVSLNTSEMQESCDSDDSCGHFASEDSTASLEDLANSGMEFIDLVTHKTSQTGNTEDFTTTPTTDASEHTTENETDDFSEEEWKTTTGTTESQSTHPFTEAIENNATSVGVTEDSNTMTEIMDSGFMITETPESSATMTELIGNTEDFTTTPTTDARKVTTENETDYLSEEKWETTTTTTESKSMNPITGTIENNTTSVGVTEDGNAITEIMDSGSTITETPESNAMMTELAGSTEDFTTTPTTDTRKVTTENETDYLSEEEWKTTTGTTESKSTNPITETIEDNATSVGVTEDSNTINEIMDSGSTMTETPESNATMTEIAGNTQDFTTTPTTDARKVTIENETDYLSEEEWETTTGTTGSKSTNPIIGTIENNATSVGVTEDSNKITEIMDSGSPITETTESSATMTESTDRNIAVTEPSQMINEIQCDRLSEDCSKSLEISTSEDQTESTESGFEPTTMATKTITTVADVRPERVMDTHFKNETEFGSLEFSTTEISTTEIGGMIEDTPEKTSSAQPTSEVSAMEETTTQEPLPASCESGRNCDFSFESDIRDATPAVIESQTELGSEATTEATTTDISGATTKVITTSTTLGGETITEEATTDINEVASEATEPPTRFVGENTTEETTTDISDATSEITAPSTTEGDQSEFTVFSSRRTTEILSGIYTGESTKDIGDTTTDVTDHTTESSAQSTTPFVFSTTIEQSDLGKITKTIPDSNSTEPVQLNDKPAIVRATETTSSTTDSISEDSTESTTESITVSSSVETTTDHSTESSAEAQITEEPATAHSCDSESDRCVSKEDNTSSSCDEESGNCVTEPSVSSKSSCDEESGDCGGSTTSSSTLPCDEESDDCIVGPSSISTTECNEDSNSSCAVTSDNQRYSTSTDNSAMCDNIGTGNCTIAPEITDLPSTTASTPIEVKNISTTVSDVPTTVESRRSTTVTAMSKNPNPTPRLALKIKILLQHIDGNKEAQNLVEVEKHLLFDEPPNEDDQRSLMNQVKSLNNTVSMQTVQALFNCSTVEELTGDVGEFAAKYFTLQDKIPNAEEPTSDFNSTGGPHVREAEDFAPRVKREVNKDVEMSLPGIHADIHAGLNHVMTRVQPEHEAEQQNVEMSEEKIPQSRLLEVVADPRDERVHARRKRQTIDDLTIDQQDLPKDLEEVGHWSNERVRRATDSGHVRTLTEFTIYKGP